jgi:hypothetical protein
MAMPAPATGFDGENSDAKSNAKDHPWPAWKESRSWVILEVRASEKAGSLAALLRGGAVERRALRIGDDPGDHHSPPHCGLVPSDSVFQRRRTGSGLKLRRCSAT